MHFRSLRKSQGDVSLSDALDGSDEGGSLSLMDVIAVEDTMLEDLDTRDARVKVRRCVDSCLDSREKKIITLRYGLDNEIPCTQREIAEICGVSRSYISRIEKKSLEKLRKVFDGEVSS
ncbi:MAG: sigma-70 family RNA polymerase sigma factor [Eubacteriales bacterium]